MTLPRLAAALAGGAAFGAVAWMPAAAVGWPFLAAVAAVPAALWVVRRPLVAVSALGVVLLLLEGDSQAFLSGETWYGNLPGLPAQPTDLLVGLAMAAVAYDVLGRRRPPLLPGRFSFPLVLVAAATLAGAVTGWFAGGDLVFLLNSARVLVYLVVVPVLAVHVLDDDRRLRGTLAAVAVLVAVKSAVGLLGWILGEGRLVDGSLLTYYSPAPNLLLMLFVLGVLAAHMARVRVPGWTTPLAVVALLTLVLSYRRSFWIAFALGAAIVLLVATRRHGRPVVLLLGAAGALALWAALAGGGRPTGTDENPLIDRVRSLSPERIEATSSDRYRLEEQRNVIAEIRRSPVRGIGLGVPWSGRYPLSEEHEGGRHYTHTTILWWWLKLGVLGAVAYVAVLLWAVAAARSVWRRSPDPYVRVAALALGASLVGLAVAETTASFTGVDTRVTVMVGIALAWLATAERRASPDQEPDGDLTAPQQGMLEHASY